MKRRVNKTSAPVRRSRAAERHVAELLEQRQLLSSVVFVGHDVADRGSVSSLFPDAEIVFLDGERSGLDEVTAALAGRSGLDSIAFFTHGAAGQIKLGNDALNAATLDAAANWGKALNPDGDIILWGCDIAAGSIGKTFVRDLAAITGADVAASTNVTGSSKLGGDWNLEFTVGAIAGVGIRGDYNGNLGIIYPVIHGAAANQPVDDNDTIAPFAGVTITDGDSTHVAGVYVFVSDMDNGGFTSSSLLASGFSYLYGNYFQLTGIRTLADAATALQALVFDPADNLDFAGQTRSTGFDIIVRDNPTLLLSYDSTTSIVATSINDAPAIGGAVAAQPTSDTNEVSPFAAITIADPDATSVTTTVTIDVAAKGAFTSASLLASGFSEISTGIYQFVGTPAANQAAIRQLSFKPTENRVAVGQTETATFTIVVDDGTLTDTNSTTTVVSTSINDAPTIGGVSGGHNIFDNATVSPFSAVTIGDVDSPAQSLDVTVTLDTPSQGGFTSASLIASGFSDTGAGTYAFSGTAGAAQAAIRQLVFQPTPNKVAVGLTQTTSFAISVDDGHASPVVDVDTEVVATSVNDAPMIGGVANGQNMLDNETISPFSAVTFTDLDSPAQILDISVTIDNAAKGAFSNASLLQSGFSLMGAGRYLFSGTASAAQTAIRQLVFVPEAGRTTPGNPETVTFSIEFSDADSGPQTNSDTIVTVASSNAPPTISPLISFSGATARERFVITYADLLAASNAVDPDNDTITFRIESVAAGVLTKGDISVTPGVTMLGVGESLVWRSAAGASGVVSAFTISASDGSTDTTVSTVAINVNVTNHATVAEGGNVDAATDLSGRTTVVTRNDAGSLVVLQNDIVNEYWTVVDLSGVAGVDNVTGDPRVFVDAGSGVTYAAVTTPDGVLLVWNDAGTWKSRNLTTELNGAPLIASDLVTFTTRNGEQVLAGILGNGDVAVYHQNGEVGNDGQPTWTSINIYDLLRQQNEATPTFHSPLTVYVTGWNGLNIAGLDASGHIWTIWTGGGEGSLSEWHSSDLTQITGASPLVGNVAAYTTEWGGINLAGIDVNGHLTITWWVPNFGSQWVTTDMTQNVGGPLLQPGSLTAYVTPWNSLNITGLDSDGEVVQYWWLAPPVEDVWVISTLTEHVSNNLPRYTGRLTGYASSDSRLSVFGTSEEGHIVRLWWSPNAAWELESLTSVT